MPRRPTEEVNIKADDLAFMGDKVILLFKCPRCRQHKEINAFGVRILKNVHSRQSHCKKCRSEQSRES